VTYAQASEKTTLEGKMNSRKIVIVGGVAGGASVAARVRRLSEDVDIIILERGSHVSFANCGLPYHIGGEITHRDQLLIQTPQGLYERFNIDVRIETEVTYIDRDKKILNVTNLATNESYEETYDQLVLSPGAEPLVPPMKGINRPGHFTLRNIRDMDNIMQWNEQVQPKHAVVIGAGFIGLEMVEQLTHLGMQITLVEAQSQVLAPTDPDIAQWVEDELKANNVSVHLNSKVTAFEDPIDDEESKASTLIFEDGQRLPADLVILSMGVRPEISLAKEAGLTVGNLGGIRVNDHMRTNDPAIWAVGDAIEVRHPVSKEWALIPLAGPANRQGRTAADNIMGRATRYRGTWGTSVVRVFEQTIACTGLNEKQLQHAGIAYEAVHVHPFSHVTYYPNAQMLLIKLLFSPEDGSIYGAQIIGKDSVERRLDVLATAIQGNMKVDDVAQLELSYAPAFGSPKDPVNIAAMVARNVINGDIHIAHPSNISTTDPATFILDVSSSSEHANMSIPNSINIPLNELRNRLAELPQDKEIIIYCFSGQRSYFAYRMLHLNGFKVRNLSGGIRNWKSLYPVVNKTSTIETSQQEESATPQEQTHIFDQFITLFILNSTRKSLISRKIEILEEKNKLLADRENNIRNQNTLLEHKDKAINYQNEQLSLGNLRNLEEKHREHELQIQEKYKQLDNHLINNTQKSEQLDEELNDITKDIEVFDKEVGESNIQIENLVDSDINKILLEKIKSYTMERKTDQLHIDSLDKQHSIKITNIYHIEKRIDLQKKLLQEKLMLLNAWKKHMSMNNNSGSTNRAKPATAFL
jgi:NADPH-dependent 2,4-dienoyl-CoA reductase/sulfur reductase-like enzyme/rhodanese-related sulfurtransferase